MENDTVVAVTSEQLIKINKQFVKVESLSKVNSLLEKDIVFCDSINQLLQAQSLTKDTVIDKYRSLWEKSELLNKNLELQIEKQKKIDREVLFLTVSFSTVVGLLTGLIL